MDNLDHKLKTLWPDLEVSPEQKEIIQEADPELLLRAANTIGKPTSLDHIYVPPWEVRDD